MQKYAQYRKLLTSLKFGRLSAFSQLTQEGVLRRISKHKLWLQELTRPCAIEDVGCTPWQLNENLDTATASYVPLPRNPATYVHGY
jgi:hypothetical protein